MSETLVVGRYVEVERLVTPELSASRLGNPGVEVLGTPAVAGMMDVLAHELLVPTLAPGQGTVGARVDVRHLAATPIGMRIRLRAEVVRIEGRKVTVALTLRDEREVAATGEVDRVLVDLDRFFAKVAKKATA